MASPPASPRRTRATVRWETAVREEKEARVEAMEAEVAAFDARPDVAKIASDARREKDEAVGAVRSAVRRMHLHVYVLACSVRGDDSRLLGVATREADTC